MATHEWMFYEVMWRKYAQGNSEPLPWWVQQYFRDWVEAYDGGLFSSKEAAFSSNANYRYWNMIGVKDHKQESLIGQAGEIEPVYDAYSLSFFLFDPATKQCHFPQLPPGGVGLTQELESGYLPAVISTWHSPLGIEVTAKAIAGVAGTDHRSLVVNRLNLTQTTSATVDAWLCISVSPAGPTGFQRHDKAGRYIADRRLTIMQFISAENRVKTNAGWGPVFDSVPAHFGVYGNGSSYDPQHYITHGPYADLATNGALNGNTVADDHIAGLCTGVFAWPVHLTSASPSYSMDVKLPVDDYRGPADLVAVQTVSPAAIESDNRTFWTTKLNGSGMQAKLPPVVTHLTDVYRSCRANLLILSDHGQIHPGPTIYDSFWIRDSSVEGIACALVGDSNLARTQFSTHYPTKFHLSHERLGPVSLYGYFGGEHEKNDHEWDSNGEALWAIGKMDRILGPAEAFGAGMFTPYVIEAARWLRDNRSPYGLLHSGWSAEHVGDKHKPHYWDDFWGIAGLWEAAQLSQRIGSPHTQEIWGIYNDLATATADSIRWVLDEQDRLGFWETFIPTGPGDVGRLDSTMIGLVAYFHPCRLYMGAKLGSDIDRAARLTLETIWSHFIEGGFRHDSAWHCFGPYLTLQLAHAFLLIGDTSRMDQLLAWSVNAGKARVDRQAGMSADQWQVVLHAWNEQHCYPIAKNFTEVPDNWWYMGDIPHGWACAEYMMLLRDILFFESDEDGSPHIYIAPGVMPHWVGNAQTLEVKDANTTLAGTFGYRLAHNASVKEVTVTITNHPAQNPAYVYPCRFGTSVVSVTIDGRNAAVTGNDVRIPAGATDILVKYS